VKGTSERSRLVRIWFKAMRRGLAAKKWQRSREAYRVAHIVAERLEQIDRPRFWWDEKREERTTA